MAPSVSIIVPIYNAESTLRRCLDSILGQTLKGIQLILVNDASDDNSGVIIEEYARKNGDCIISVKSDGGGCGYARNKGLPFATGKYIGFVDADDYIDQSMYEKLYSIAEYHDSDIAICDFKGPRTEEHHFDNYPEVFSFGTENLSLANIHSSSLLWFVFKGIYRRELLSRNNITFCNKRIPEDSLFNMSVFSVCNKIALVKEQLYIYDDLNTLSITRKRFKPNLLSELQELYHEKLLLYEKYNIVSYEQDLDSYTMRHTLPMLLSNMLANPDGITLRELKRLRETSMVDNSYRNVSPSIIDSNLKYLAFLLKYKFYFVSKILMNIKILQSNIRIGKLS